MEKEGTIEGTRVLHGIGVVRLAGVIYSIRSSRSTLDGRPLISN